MAPLGRVAGMGAAVLGTVTTAGGALLGGLTDNAFDGTALPFASPLLVYAVVEAPDSGWGSPQTLLLLAGSVVLAAVFAAIESRHRAPLLPLRLLRSRTLVGANGVMLMFGTLSVKTRLITT